MTSKPKQRCKARPSSSLRATTAATGSAEVRFRPNSRRVPQISRLTTSPVAQQRPTTYTDANGNLWQPSIDEEAASANITVVGGTKFQPSYDPSGNDLSTVGDGLESV